MFTAFSSLLMGLPAAGAGADVPEPSAEADLSWGVTLYGRHCAECHGARGDGEGPAAEYLSPLPRDFTRGDFALRTTESGAIPTDGDLFRTISRGIPGTPMPPWGAVLSDEARWALVKRIKAFSPRFVEEPLEDDQLVTVPDPPPTSDALVAKGRQIYERFKCGECHGPTGRGDGPAADTLHDDRKRRIRPYDFTSGDAFKGGGEPRDVFRTFSTGLTGTPMPSFADSIPDVDERWALVHFVLSLRREKTALEYLFVDQPSRLP